MSPEKLSGTPTDVRTDVFELGLILQRLKDVDGASVLRELSWIISMCERESAPCKLSGMEHLDRSLEQAIAEVRLSQTLIDEEPDRYVFQVIALRPSVRRAHALIQLGDLDQAVEECDRTIEFGLGLVAANPGRTDTRRLVRSNLNSLSGVWRAAGLPADAAPTEEAAAALAIEP